MAGNIFRHIVETELKFVTRNGKKVEETTRQIDQLRAGVQKVTVQQKKWDNAGKESVTTTERNIRGFQRFQMEQLGVMFAGMALNRAMSNLNATSREWLGIGELTSTMMGVTMLQANMDLLNFGILPLFDALVNLPPEAQRAIGHLTLGLEGLGGVMMVGGQLALGINSMVILLQKLGLQSVTTTGLLKGLAGVSLLGLSVVLGGIAISTEGGVGILAMLGTGLAIALGTVLLGASAAAGIALGVITVSAILAYKLSQESLGSEAFQKAAPFGADVTSATPGLPEHIAAGLTGQVIPRLSPELQEMIGEGRDLLGGGGTSMNVTYNVNVSDKREFEELLKKNNSDLVAQTRRETQT